MERYYGLTSEESQPTKQSVMIMRGEEERRCERRKHRDILTECSTHTPLQLALNSHMAHAKNSKTPQKDLKTCNTIHTTPSTARCSWTSLRHCIDFHYTISFNKRIGINNKITNGALQ